MLCPFCDHKTEIYNSRASHQQTQTWRRRRCRSCSRTFTTKERIDWNGSTEIRTDVATRPYSRDRLLTSLLIAAHDLELSPETISELTDSIEYELQKTGFFSQPLHASQLIVETATSVLSRFEPNVALLYINKVYRGRPPLELVKQLVDAPD